MIRLAALSLCIALYAFNVSAAECPPGWFRSAGECVPLPAPDAEPYSSSRKSKRASHAHHAKVKESPRKSILETGYAVLPSINSERAGYGLYSYAILLSKSGRSARFLSEIFASTPAIEETAADPDQLNIFYIPIQNKQQSRFNRKSLSAATTHHDFMKIGESFVNSFYDFQMARAILNHLCNPPSENMREMCGSDLKGPYIFTYTAAASKLAPVPPPYLFVDLSTVHERAFAEVLSAFREQVKRDDISDNARIDTLRLRILQLVLTGSDWIGPMEHTIAEIVRSAMAQDK